VLCFLAMHVFALCLVCQMLLVPLDCQFVIVHSVFCNVYNVSIVQHSLGLILLYIHAYVVINTIILQFQNEEFFIKNKKQ